MRILLAGALGEVGSSVGAALVDAGHEVVPVSGRAPLPGSTALPISAAADLVAARGVDLVVNASGPGDRRQDRAPGSSATSALAPGIRATGLPAVLLSTTRVLEGWDHDVMEDAAPRPRTAYAQANADHESEWTSEVGPTAHVLRIANYFCTPLSIDSPQAQLLPWSLVTEALEAGAVTVRSSRDTSREFVGAGDVASGALILAGAPTPRVAATAPGTVLTLADLVDAVSGAFEDVGRERPAATFGAGPAVVAPRCRPGYLAEHGWTSTVTVDIIREAIARWVR